MLINQFFKVCNYLFINHLKGVETMFKTTFIVIITTFIVINTPD